MVVWSVCRPFARFPFPSPPPSLSCSNRTEPWMEHGTLLFTLTETGTEGLPQERLEGGGLGEEEENDKLKINSRGKGPTWGGWGTPGVGWRGRVGGVVSEIPLPEWTLALAFRMKKTTCSRTWNMTSLGSNLSHHGTWIICFTTLRLSFHLCCKELLSAWHQKKTKKNKKQNCWMVFVITYLPGKSMTICVASFCLIL